MISPSLILPFLFAFGASSLCALEKALHILGRIQSKKVFHKKPYHFFIYSLIKKGFPKDPWENFFYVLSFTKHLLRLLYGTIFFFYLFSSFVYKNQGQNALFFDVTVFTIIVSISIVIAIGLLSDFLFLCFTSLNPHLILNSVIPFTTFFICLFSPITFLFLKLQKTVFQKKEGSFYKQSREKVKDKILEMVHESELSQYLDPFDQRIITAVASIGDRIAREIMVPRIDMVTLPAHQTVYEAAKRFISEGYSRIPIYRENVDTIVGVLLCKDVMACLVKSLDQKDNALLKTPLEKLVKPVLYAPETKKVSVLLQEFRNEQIHLAIVVDEYGGTEGIVTIEDILEELVGEIADEFDSIEEEKLHIPHPHGGWIIDGKMTIFDLEKETGIVIPKNPEYETIGGYIFHCAGTIPLKGWKLHHNAFDLEVIDSNEKGIDKVLIVPNTK